MKYLRSHDTNKRVMLKEQLLSLLAQSKITIIDSVKYTQLHDPPQIPIHLNGYE